MSLYFVTPAFGRFELTAICLDQRLDAIRTLAESGIEARCVVVADDENLDIARARGFDVVERDNDYLGRRFNDGMEFAGKAGAEWIVPVGSDSWIDPAYFLPVPAAGTTRTSTFYAAVTEDRIAELAVTSPHGAGPYVFHRSVLAWSGFRPAGEELHRYIDSSTFRGLGRDVVCQPHDVQPFQYIGFRGRPHLTPYERLVERWGVMEHSDPWAILAQHYPAELVERARVALAPVAA